MSTQATKDSDSDRRAAARNYFVMAAEAVMGELREPASFYHRQARQILEGVES